MVVLEFCLLFLAQRPTTQVVVVAAHMLGQEPGPVDAVEAALAEIVPVPLPHQTQLPIVAEVAVVAGSLTTLVAQAALESLSSVTHLLTPLRRLQARP
jgi:hypothetical protein